MRSLSRRPKETSKMRRDPAPSRLAWRLQRLLLTPLFWFAVRYVVPVVLILGAAGLWFAVPDNRAAVSDRFAEIRNNFVERPEFMVNLISIDGADADLDQAIRAAVPFELPVSSFDLDLEAFRGSIAQLPPVQSVSMRVKTGGVLEISVTPRVGVAIWRSPAGLALVDDEGVVFADVASRLDHPDLPVIAGDGATAHVGEAMALVATMSPLRPRLRGLVRVGERRWDVVLDRGQRIMLPEYNAARALDRLIALQSAQDVLGRDVSHVDLRLPHRPTVRLNPQAAEQFAQNRALVFDSP